MSNKWPLTPLGDVLTERNEEPLLEDLTTGRVRIVEKISFDSSRIQLRADSTTKTGMILVRPGDLLVSGINAAKGAIAIYDEAATEPVAATIHYGAYIPNRERVSVRFLWLMLRSRFFQELLLKYVPGGIKTELKAARLLPVPVPLPPLAEQRGIVARIEELAAQIEEARKLRREAVVEAEGLYEASVGNTMSQLVRFSKQRLGNLTTKIGSGSTPLGGRASYPSSGVPFIRSLNVRMRHFQWEDIVFISPETHAQMASTCVRPGDVLLNITGASIGRVACAPANLNESNVNQHVAIIRPRDTELSPRYLMYWLSQPSIQDVINDTQKGATRQGFTKAQISALSIPIPPLAEQRRIVAELDALQAQVDKLKRLQAETAAELDALLPSILDCAFKGEL